jgi:hypothetical protein
MGMNDVEYCFLNSVKSELSYVQSQSRRSRERLLPFLRHGHHRLVLVGRCGIESLAPVGMRFTHHCRRAFPADAVVSGSLGLPNLGFG